MWPVAEDVDRLESTSDRNVPCHNSRAVEPTGTGDFPQRAIANAISLGPTVEKELLYRLARLSARTPQETASDVFSHLQTFPPRYHSHGINYLVRQMFASLPESSDMIQLYASLSGSLQDLFVDAAQPHEQELPLAIFEESREALFDLCGLGVSVADAASQGEWCRASREGGCPPSLLTLLPISAWTSIEIRSMARFPSLPPPPPTHRRKPRQRIPHRNPEQGGAV